MAVWYAKNKESALAMSKRWRDSNPGAAWASTKKWRDANKEKVKLLHKHWRERNADKIRVWRAAQRAAKRAATVVLTPHEQADVIALYAKARALTELTGETYHVDHIKPLARGGLHHPRNLQVLRGIDNLRKGVKQ